MRIFYVVAIVIFSIASYQMFTDDVDQPILGMALGGGLGWFVGSLVKEIT